MMVSMGTRHSVNPACIWLPGYSTPTRAMPTLLTMEVNWLPGNGQGCRMRYFKRSILWGEARVWKVTNYTPDATALEMALKTNNNQASVEGTT